MKNNLFKLNRESAPQSQCHLAVEARLNQISAELIEPASVCIFIVSLLMQSIETEESPIFIFPRENFEEATALILSWVENEQQRHLLLPALKLHFAWAITVELDEMLKNPERFGEDARLVQTKLEWWQRQAQEA